MKRIFSMVLALAMVLSLGVFPVIAETATTSVTAPTPTAPILPEYTGTKSSIKFTDTYNDCILMTVKGTNEEAFNAYLTTLTSGGYTQVVAPRAVLGTANKASIYTKGTDYLVNALWDATDKEAKITIEPLNGLDLSVFDPNSATTGNVTPLLIQVGLDDVENKNTVGNGMCYIYRLSDGRFVIFDGGGKNDTVDKNLAARIYKILNEYNTAGNEITIAAWYITHPHTDHIGAFMAFTKYYVGVDVTLEKVICNLPNVTEQSKAAVKGTSQALTETKVKEYNARLMELDAQGVDIYKAHVGQMYYIGNLTIEIMYTYDLLSPDVTIANQGAYGTEGAEGYVAKDDYTNTFSVVSQATLNVDGNAHKAIWTGDVTGLGIEQMNSMYGTAMKSDFVQTPHHGWTQTTRVEITQEEHKSGKYKFSGYVSSDGKYYNFYYDYQVDLFYGDNTTKTAIGTTGYYNSLYDADGYGYVRAKYVLYPVAVEGASGYVGNNATRTTWHPTFHLQLEVGEDNLFIAGSTLTVFTFDGANVTPSINDTVITADIELPATTDGDYTLVYGSDDFKSMTASGKYKLAKDITVVNPTGSLCAKTFTGTLDGDGHTIKVAYTDNGATAFTGSDGFVFDGLNGATVQNLTVDGAEINNTSTSGFNIGFLAFLASGTTTIDNVHISNATFTDNANMAGNIGGFIGHTATDANVTIKNSSFNGTITNTTGKGTYVGGFFGRAGNSTAGATVVNIENCTVSGSLSHTYAGGFVGQAKTTSTLAIKNSTNNATVTATTAAGGMLAYNTTACTSITFINCTNNGAITSDTSAAGGIMGHHGTAGGVAFTFQSCVNTGDISSSAHRAAGIVAHIGNTNGTVKIADCVNYGKVASTATTAPTTTTVNAASIVCMISTGTVTYTNCANFGAREGWSGCIAGGTVTGTKDTSPAMYNSIYGSTKKTESNNTDFAAAGITNVTEAVKMTDGVDYVGTATAPTGLRFDVAVNAELITALQNKGYTVTLGALVSTENNVQKAGYVFTVDALATLSTGASGYRVEEIANGDIANFLNGSDSYAITLPDLQNTTREYNAVGFMKITKNSVSTTIYAQYDPAEAKSLSGIQ